MSEKYQYGVRVKRSTPELLGELAKELGFVVDQPGGFYGMPANGSMLDLLAEKADEDLQHVVVIFRSLGVSA